MSEVLEFDGVDAIGTGAIGVPGQRAFYLQARKGNSQLTVLVEKEQIAMLTREATEFLDRLAEEFPEDPSDVGAVLGMEADLREPTVPLFRVRVIGIGFDPSRRQMLLELREHQAETDLGPGPMFDGDKQTDGYIARVYASRAQVRAMCARGEEAVAAGRPPCPLCFGPMNVDGHQCPRWN
ncbi:MAG: DUF3090 family protein [Acidimicrobiia bacterium]